MVRDSIKKKKLERLRLNRKLKEAEAGENFRLWSVRSLARARD
jgi:hypothetical protein